MFECKVDFCQICGSSYGACFPVPEQILCLTEMFPSLHMVEQAVILHTMRTPYLPVFILIVKQPKCTQNKHMYYLLLSIVPIVEM